MSTNETNQYSLLELYYERGLVTNQDACARREGNMAVCSKLVRLVLSLSLFVAVPKS